jgi:hypothetical protein
MLCASTAGEGIPSFWSEDIKLAAGKFALPEGYGLQAVHNCCVMNPALATGAATLLETALCPQPARLSEAAGK